MAKMLPFIARTQGRANSPKGRRRYDPVTDRCRADNIYVRTNKDGTKSRLSRGRWISCGKQVKSTKAYREAGGFGDATEWDLVVSDTWVPPKDRAAKTRRVPVGAFFKSLKEIRGERKAARLAAIGLQPSHKSVEGPKTGVKKRAPKKPVDVKPKLVGLPSTKKKMRYSEDFDAGVQALPLLRVAGRR